MAIAAASSRSSGCRPERVIASLPSYTSYLEQLEAQRNLLAVELALVQLEADQINALVALHQAVGGRWTAPVR